MLKIALIPAKSNSRRLPGKNKRLLGDKPLFAHSVDVALKSSEIDKVIVSSDSDDILEIARELGAIAIKRPVQLCGDNVPNLNVCKHVVDTLNNEGDDVELMVLLQPTHPFRTAEELDKAIKTFTLNQEFDSLASVSSAHRVRGTILSDHGWEQENQAQQERAQTKNDSFEITGHLFILRVKNTIERQLLFGKRVYAWKLPKSWLDIDIDTEQDFLIAQAVIEK